MDQQKRTQEGFQLDTWIITFLWSPSDWLTNQTGLVENWAKNMAVNHFTTKIYSWKCNILLIIFSLPKLLPKEPIV